MVQSGYIKKHSRLIALLQQWIDIAIIWLVLQSAFWVYHASLLPKKYLIASTIATFAWYFFSNSQRVYQSWRNNDAMNVAAMSLRAWFMVAAVLIVVAWASKTSADYSRIVIGSWFLITPIVMTAARVLVKKLLTQARSKGYNSRHIIIAGTGPSAKALIKEIECSPWMGYRIQGVYQLDGQENLLDDKHQVLGDLQQLVLDAKSSSCDGIFIALPMAAEYDIAELVNALSDNSAPVHIVPDLFTFELLNANLGSIGSIPLLSIYESPHEGTNRLLKRIEDIVLASVITLLISPILLLIALSVKFTSAGPIIFKQRRYGMGGEAIEVWKFRSMTVCDDGDTIVQATKGDQRITKLGAFLRKTSLDELPQFINVLQGRMSIVGPRPHAVAHNELYRKDIKGYMLRHLVKPGITGWAQVNGWRGETDTLEKMQKRVEFDLYYIRNWSIFFDLKIIFLTVFKGFVDKNAY